MKWDDLLHIVAREPVFNSSLLLAGDVTPLDLRKQLCRWVRSGRLLQIRRGLYTLANPFRKVTPHPFLVANRIKRASCISLQSALSFYNMIPEYVPVVTSVTTGRPERFETPLGGYLFKHISSAWFSSFRNIDLGEGQWALIATPEKALLDLIYLTPGAHNLDYLEELRLENLDRLNVDLLMKLVETRGGNKLKDAVKNILILKNRQEHLVTL
jgi:predicted transcriptional regulator of viral defense system